MGGAVVCGRAQRLAAVALGPGDRAVSGAGGAFGGAHVGAAAAKLHGHVHREEVRGDIGLVDIYGSCGDHTHGRLWDTTI